ncbi:MAG: hypothetical protein MO847_12115 [Candidatus Protistobacter heckmanni]|nr:hypothetical protein [Candidatus Protistobacter heckmanni]
MAITPGYIQRMRASGKGADEAADLLRNELGIQLSESEYKDIELGADSVMEGNPYAIATFYLGIAVKSMSPQNLADKMAAANYAAVVTRWQRSGKLEADYLYTNLMDTLSDNFGLRVQR